LTYESTWKPTIDKEWKAFETDWKAKNPGMKINKTRFEFMNAFMKEKFKNETPEMKAKVATHIETYKTSKAAIQDVEKRNLDLQE